MFYFHKWPDNANDVAPGNGVVGLLRRPWPVTPTPAPPSPASPPNGGAETPRCWWEKGSPPKTIHRGDHCHCQPKSPCHAPSFRYHPRNSVPWLKLFHHFQHRLAALHNLPPYPHVMPPMPSTVTNLYLICPYHIADPSIDTVADPLSVANQYNTATNDLPSPMMLPTWLSNDRSMKTTNQAHQPPPARWISFLVDTLSLGRAENSNLQYE